MESKSITIRNWDILFLCEYDVWDVDDIMSALSWADAPMAIHDRVFSNVVGGRLDEGFCYSNPSLRRVVAAMGRASSGGEFLSSFCHELRHIADDIAVTDGIDLTGEKIAYLTGEIARMLSNQVCRFTCDHCRNVTEESYSQHN